LAVCVDRYSAKAFSASAERPWQVIVKGNVSQSELKMKSTIDGSTIFGEVASDLVWEPTIKTTPSTYAGVWAGYAYNLVPCRGLLINAMFMPMLTVYDRHKTWRYDSNLRDQAINNVLYNEDELIESDYRLKEEPLSVTDSHSPIALNFDTRLSLTYQWNWLFINAYGQFSRFHFKEGCVKGTLLDWYVNASIGVRF